jgi:hypothetical protein
MVAKSRFRGSATPRTAAYTVTLTHDGESATFSGEFSAVDDGLPGLLRADGWNFARGDRPFFWNSTTAYLMAGLRDDLMFAALDRLADHGINRVRVALCPTRQENGGRWYEPQVTPSDAFTFCFSPWICAQPDVWNDPRPDTTRFDIAHFQKFERLLAHASKRGIVAQVIFFVDAQEPQNYPFTRPAPKPDGATDFDDSTCPPDASEHLYFDYAVARLAAFANVEWCVTNEWALFQSNAWVERIGARIADADPYGHALSVHGHGHFPFRASDWCTHCLFQVWDEHGGGEWARKMRAEQEATGIVKPQVNEEYGYEDHYPGPWGGGRTAPARSAENRALLAKEIIDAGAHQTTGESAASGGPFGGWINGLAEDDTLLKLHAKLRAEAERR